MNTLRKLASMSALVLAVLLTGCAADIPDVAGPPSADDRCSVEDYSQIAVDPYIYRSWFQTCPHDGVEYTEHCTFGGRGGGCQVIEIDGETVFPTASR